jgi:hypothetical protein
MVAVRFYAAVEDNVVVETFVSSRPIRFMVRHRGYLTTAFSTLEHTHYKPYATYEAACVGATFMRECYPDKKILPVYETPERMRAGDRLQIAVGMEAEAYAPSNHEAAHHEIALLESIWRQS